MNNIDQIALLPRVFGDRFQICPQKTGLISGKAKNLSFAAYEPFFTGHAKVSTRHGAAFFLLAI